MRAVCPDDVDSRFLWTVGIYILSPLYMASHSIWQQSSKATFLSQHKLWPFHFAIFYKSSFIQSKASLPNSHKLQLCIYELDCIAKRRKQYFIFCLTTLLVVQYRSLDCTGKACGLMRPWPNFSTKPKFLWADWENPRKPSGLKNEIWTFQIGSRKTRYSNGEVVFVWGILC